MPPEKSKGRPKGSLNKNPKPPRTEPRDSKKYWDTYWIKNRERINQKQRERYWADRDSKLAYNRQWASEHKDYWKERYHRKREEQRVTEYERVRALLGNLKNWSWDVEPQFRIEKEDSDALQHYVKDLEKERNKLSQMVNELEGKLYAKE